MITSILSRFLKQKPLKKLNKKEAIEYISTHSIKKGLNFYNQHINHKLKACESVNQALIDRHPVNIRYIPHEYITEAQCTKAVAQERSMIFAIPEHFISFEMLKMVCLSDNSQIDYFKNLIHLMDANQLLNLCREKKTLFSEIPIDFLTKEIIDEGIEYIPFNRIPSEIVTFDHLIERLKIEKWHRVEFMHLNSVADNIIESSLADENKENILRKWNQYLSLVNVEELRTYYSRNRIFLTDFFENFVVQELNGFILTTHEKYSEKVMDLLSEMAEHCHRLNIYNEASGTLVEKAINKNIEQSVGKRARPKRTVFNTL